MSKKEIKIKDLRLSETKNTNLVGMIGVFMIMISGLGNQSIEANAYSKSNVLESSRITAQNIMQNNLSVGKQTIVIGGQEYIVEIYPKY